MRKKLNSYKGPLLPSEIAVGINATRINSRRLIDDAELLLHKNRFPSAAALAILSIEEGEKGSILLALPFAKSDGEILSEWKKYRSHTRKNVGWIAPDLIFNGARTFEDFRPIFDSKSDHPFLLDNLKQLCFYTDCLGQRNWANPSEIVNESIANEIVKTARRLAPTEDVTVREIELWIQHMEPVYAKDLVQMKQAVISWYTAMQNEGLKPPGENIMAKLMGMVEGGPPLKEGD